jgi:hypothetical protein
VVRSRNAKPLDGANGDFIAVQTQPRGSATRRPSFREILAALGVVLSLTFVGYELRQNTIAVQGQTRDSLARAGEDWLMGIAADSSLSAALAKMSRDEPMSSSDSTRLQYALLAVTRHHENVYLQVTAGTVDESGLLTYGWKGTALYTFSFYETSVWPRFRSIFSPDFIAAHEEAFPNLRSP